MRLGTRLGSGRHDCPPPQRSHSGKDEYHIMSGFNLIHCRLHVAGKVLMMVGQIIALYSSLAGQTIQEFCSTHRSTYFKATQHTVS